MANGRPDRWERTAEWPLTIAALLFLIAYAWPILDEDLPAPWPDTCLAVTWATWAAFVLDYVARLVLSSHRWYFIRKNLIDLLVVVLPALRPLRLLRLVMLLSVVNRYAATSLRGRVAVYIAGSASLVVFVGSVAMLDAERGHPGANIETFGDALWWALSTVTTVGYGDRYPVTTQGRFVAAGLMLAGVALLGMITATLASWLIDRVSEVEESSQAATRRDIEALRTQVAALQDLLLGGERGDDNQRRF